MQRSEPSSPRRCSGNAGSPRIQFSLLTHWAQNVTYGINDLCLLRHDPPGWHVDVVVVRWALLNFAGFAFMAPCAFYRRILWCGVNYGGHYMNCGWWKNAKASDRGHRRAATSAECRNEWRFPQNWGIWWHSCRGAEAVNHQRMCFV